MENMDTSRLKDQKTMDASTVWKWRITNAKKYFRDPDPFQYSNKIGLEFNVASKQKQKLDLELMTNDVILEVWDFAQTVTKSKWLFVTNILENNFDLGFKNEQQRIDFTAQIVHKVKDLVREPPHDKHEVFALFDTSSKSECTSNSNNGLNMTSPDTECFLQQVDDTDNSEHEEEFKCSQATSKEYTETESLLDDMDVAHAVKSEQEDKFKFSEVQSEKQLKEDLPPSFPYCEEIGLNLDIGSKQSLDPGLLTKGVMLELVHFTRVLTSSYSRIIMDVLEHNFELNLKDQQVKNRVWFKISHLLKRRRQLTTTGSQTAPEFKDEPFSFQTNPFKKPRGSALSEHTQEHTQDHLQNPTNSDIPREPESSCEDTHQNFLTTSDVSPSLPPVNSNVKPPFASQPDKRRLCAGEEPAQIPRNALKEFDIEQEKMGTENYYTCPVGESDLDSDKLTDSENIGNQDHLQNPKSCSVSSDIPKVSESDFHGICAPFLTSTDISPNVPTVNLNIDSSFASKVEKGLCGEDKLTQTSRIASNECGLEQEEMGPGDIMWRLRANRVEHILSAQNKEFCQFTFSRRYGLEFNVGFGPKQNISVDFLINSVLLEVAKFSLAMNSSQRDFIMEILEYNFDLGLQTQQQRNTFTCEMMNRVRQLRKCEDAVKLSNEVFELPGPMPSLNMSNQSVDSVIPELSSMSREKYDVAPARPPDSHAETKEHTGIIDQSVDLYPFCKKIGLKLHVNHSQPNKKLDINKLTNGAMTEVTNFAEKLCGTFEQICVDIIRHNFDLDLESGDSDLTKNILAQISAAVEQRNLSSCVVTKFKRNPAKYNPKIRKQKCQNYLNLDACSAGSSQAEITDNNVGSSADSEYKKEQNLKLWKVRADQIQRILSIPHEEHCPLYSYTRCKKLGIDFNVGSGVKQNLDPKLLTHGIMVELRVFATALVLARKDFITEILEQNFDLNFENELCRSAFALQTLSRCYRVNRIKGCSSPLQLKLPFELPDIKSIKEATTYCPKCYQDRNHNLHQGGSDTGHMHHLHPFTRKDKVYGDVNSSAEESAKEPWSSFSTTEKTMMDNYPLCKKIGLNLFVDREQPEDKLDTHVLTRGIMMEVAQFARKLCGTINEVVNDLLKHNFNIGMKSQDLNPATLFYTEMSRKHDGLAWLDEAFVIQRYPHRPPGDIRKLKRETAMQGNELKETIKRRKLALKTNERRNTLQSPKKRVVKSKKTYGRTVNCYPNCTKIGLDLDVTSKSGDKEKLDLKLLTRAVVLEVHEFATKVVGRYYARTVFDILDYNFDLSSIYHRRWEFITATASKIQTMVKQYCGQLYRAVEVFTLPFAMDPEVSRRFIDSRQNNISANVSMDIETSSLPTVDSNWNPPFGRKPEKLGFCRGEKQKQAARNASNETDFKQEILSTENYYVCPLGESDLDSDENSENTGNQDHFKDPESCSLSSDIPRESESICLDVRAPFHTSTDISSSLPTVNSNIDPPFANQVEKGLCGEDELTQTSRIASNECGLEQEEMGPGDIMWKLRANRVEHILSAQNKEFALVYWSKKIGLEFNVGFGPKQNRSADSLTNAIQLEIAEFSLAMNSSQQDFIMEILEYNFDLGLQTQQQRNTFACEMMNRVRQLRKCEDAVKLSNEVFELPGSELSSISRKKCDVAPVCPPGSHAETNAHTSNLDKSVALYPFCKQIGLKLHVNNSQPNKKLDINTLTNGAITEVTNFAEKLCGTFEQICFDIIRHNFDLDLQSGDSDLTKNILARITAAVEQKNLSSCVVTNFRRKHIKNIKGMKKQRGQNNLNLDACSAGSSQAEITDNNAGSSADSEYKKEQNLKLWKVRANQIQRILSIPHEQHCPLYSYTRCKKLGIDFNVGSGVKQNLDPKLLTNGVMVELRTFEKALLLSKKHFITEILEYNFDLNFKNELYRSAFRNQIMDKLYFMHSSYRPPFLLKKPFELPNLSCIQEPTFEKTTYCPKCYQARNHMLCEDESDAGHISHPRPHIMTDTVSFHANCAAQKTLKDLSSTLTTEETIMDGYPLCKEIGLNLFVDKEQRNDKLDTHVLTWEVMIEVAHFAQNLCGTDNKIIHTLLEHNFNIDLQILSLGFSLCLFSTRGRAQNNDKVAWLSEVFPFLPVYHGKPGYVSKLEKETVMHGSERKETIQKRKLALQTKKEKATLTRENISVKVQKKYRYPICIKIGLDLDVASKSGEKEKLDLKLLTRAVVLEIHRFASIFKVGQYFPGILFDILDYNFDLSSQHDRRWEFSIATASKVRVLVKYYSTNRDRANEVFKLPFVFPPKTKPIFTERTQKKCEKSYYKEPDKEQSQSRFVRQVRYHSDVTCVSFLSGVQTIKEPKEEREHTPIDSSHFEVVSNTESEVDIKQEFLML